MKVTLIRITENPVEAIELAASNCYDSQPMNGKIMDNCYKSGHHSVLEFTDFHFHVEGVSRALSHQLVRSRLASFAQRSQRYCTEDDFKYVTPDSIQNHKNPDILNVYNKAMDVIQRGYDILLSHNIPEEDARFVLPNACETVIDMAMNLREMIHFCNERLCTCSQWEIRELANSMRKLIIEKEPKFAKYLVPKCEKDSPYCVCTESKSRCCGRHIHISEAYPDLIV